VLTADGQVHDPKRIEYLKLHFAATHKAIEQGVKVKGYSCWSLMDNFEWAWAILGALARLCGFRHTAAHPQG
jgi:beta-glucosidase/6-phospho-beta-glucosidase/beta-galactosidase